MKKRIANMFRRLSIFEAMVGNKMQSMAYKRASDVFYAYDETVLMEMLQKGSLIEVDGIGSVIASMAYQVRDTGQMTKLVNYERDIPVDIDDMLSMSGIGPKTVYKLYTSLGVKCWDDVKAFGGRFPHKVEGISKVKERLIFERVGHKQPEQQKLF